MTLSTAMSKALDSVQLGILVHVIKTFIVTMSQN
jgi:hypothetical protein